jgi:uncharacterized protein YggE
MRRFRILGIVALALGVAVFVAFARPHGGAAAAPDTTNTITVTGTGSVTTVPDRASFSFSVESRAATAAAALTKNSAETRAVIAAVKAAGVDAADIQTAQVSLSPQMSQDGKSIDGYVATNSIVAKIRDLGIAGRVVDAAVSAGASGVGGPSLFRSDDAALYNAALKAAVTQARGKAEALAAAAGLSLGRVRTIVEGGGPVPMPLGADKSSGVVGPPIEPGTTEVTASVSVTFAAG